MKVQIITFKCNLKNRAGQLISSSYNRDVLNSPEQGGVLAALSKELQSLSPGEKRSISLGAHEAYGPYDLNKVLSFPRARLPENLRVGSVVAISDSNRAPQNYRVVELGTRSVILDRNHPLAGQDLIFEIEMLACREAKPDEVEDTRAFSGEMLLH